MVELVIILSIGFIIMTILWRKTAEIAKIAAGQNYGHGYQAGFWVGFKNGRIDPKRVVFKDLNLYILPVCSLISKDPILECYSCEYSEVCSRFEK